MNHLSKPHHRSSKRYHQQLLDNFSSPSSYNNKSNESNNETSNLLNISNNNSNNNSAITNINKVSFRAINKPFIIRPPLSSAISNLSLVKPLLVLINPKSGGKLGPKLLKKFSWYLNPRQVFDLTQTGCPKFP
jgi:hypothetical protein